MGGERLEQGSGTLAGGQGFLGALHGAGTEGEPQAGRGAGRLPGIVVEDARRVAQKPAPKLLPLPADRGVCTFSVGGVHDTGAGNPYLSLTRALPARSRPLPEGERSGREKTEAGRGEEGRGGAGRPWGRGGLGVGYPGGARGPSGRAGLLGEGEVAGCRPRVVCP